LSVTAAGAAVADDLWNDIDGSMPTQNTLDNSAEVLSRTIGSTVTVTFRLKAVTAAGDPAGCNVSTTKPTTFAITSSTPDVAAITAVNGAALTSSTPAVIAFTSCSTEATQSITVTTKAAGTTTFSASVVSTAVAANSVSTAFNLLPAQFRVDVVPPSNTAPSITVSGLEETEFVKGTFPAATCHVKDAEDGDRDFPATNVYKQEGRDGLGEWVARCFYQDAGKLTALATPSFQVVDPTPPVIRYWVNGRLGASSWVEDGVTPWLREKTGARLQWAVDDAEGPTWIEKEKDTCVDANIVADTEQTFTCTAWSNSGEKQTVRVTVRQDANGPRVVGQITSVPAYQAADGTTWYRDSAAVRWTVEDAVSGVTKREEVKVGGERVTLGGDVTAPVTTVVDKEGRAQMSRVVGTDGAGNVDGTTVTGINVDGSAPVIEAKPTTSPVYDGWYKDTVDVAVKATDPEVTPLERGSGLKVDPTKVHTFTTSGTHAFTATATDNVGHSTQLPVSVKVDAKAPVVSASCPAAPVLKNSASPASAVWSASDEASGVAGADRGPLTLDTTTVNWKTATVAAGAAKDNVGHHSAQASCRYQVVYPFTGFFAPVDNKGVLNQVKAGSAVPLKFSLGRNEGLMVLDGAPVVTKFTCSSSAATDSLEETAIATTSGLKYDALANQYNYTWKTTSQMAGTCQKLTVKLVDGTSQTALFKLTK